MNVPQSISSAGRLASNPLRNRADAAVLVRQLYEPLLPGVSTGGARVRIGEDVAHYERVCSELEGFSRPIWAIAPLLAGGQTFPHLELIQRGLANGSDPAHPEYWGPVGDRDQRAVEMAAIGYALAVAPKHFWEPLSDAARRNLGAWLSAVQRVEVHDSNWRFFVVLVQEGLRKVGLPVDERVRNAHLDRLDEFYLGDGWYGDGPEGFIDHYNGFALHCYGLLLAALDDGRDRARSERYLERAARFAKDFRYWVADDGASLAMGRSLTYRFGMASFWGALAVANCEALPWAEIRGLWARSVRWWLAQPMLDPVGRLTVGFRWPNALMMEEYNAPASSYWAMKAFLPLSLPETHPFWRAEEAPAPDDLESEVASMPARMIMRRRSGHTIALTGGPIREDLRNAADKYGKFAYSTCFGFCVESDRWLHLGCAGDNTLAISLDGGRHWHVRERMLKSEIEDGVLKTHWSCWTGVEIETLQFFLGEWEIRVHRISSDRALETVETGFAAPGRAGARRWHDVDLPATDENAPLLSEARILRDGACSAIVDISGGRVAKQMGVMPNCNILFPHAAVPALSAALPAGQSLLIAAVYADPAGREPSPPPSANQIVERLARLGLAAGHLLETRNANA